MDTKDCSDIYRLEVADKKIVLIGTAHISSDSVNTVRQVIAEEQPDSVCIELDQQRYRSLTDAKAWQSLDLVKAIRQGQGPFLLANLALSAFQKRMGLQTGVKPGAELAAAAEAAKEQGAEICLIDREIRTTLLRAWRKTGLWKKLQVFAALFSGLFESQEIDEEQLSALRQGDTLTAMLDEMGDMLPAMKTVLVDERDQYMAEHLRQAPGKRLVAVVGAAHVPGIRRRLAEQSDPGCIDELSLIPPKPPLSRVLPWIIPAVVVGLFLVGFLFGDRSQLTEAAIAWVLANGLLSAAGTVLALGHPLAIVTAFVAAPITSLNPTIGAGFVTGLVQAMIAGPTVRDLEEAGNDLATARGWWSNRLTRVLLVFFFSSLGSSLGTLLAFSWLKNLI
ncbi:conjugal transfer protein TraB [Syntrophotalea acetylenivorans]|uniref:Conjugal transfer protein TraB n=1 Tax=Syntrophotalea acetylenivorans TaxID=1842532 RepID=A0A1L3GN84_9BACT|nr:TraB/GumN family protein [Syntrophotalea acetylenivorans]APG27371.1 conjugal transfer protein TraB [Syntrophotalea acetylenivorans]